jgi:hypothetical protein
VKLKLIEDGFVLPFACAVGDGPELSGTFRPAVPAEVDSYRVGLAKAKPGADRERVRAKHLASHLQTWDAEGAGGPAELTADNLLKVPAGYLDALEARVNGYYFEKAAGDAEKNSLRRPPGAARTRVAADVRRLSDVVVPRRGGQPAGPPRDRHGPRGQAGPPAEGSGPAVLAVPESPG